MRVLRTYDPSRHNSRWVRILSAVAAGGVMRMGDMNRAVRKRGLEADGRTRRTHNGEKQKTIWAVRALIDAGLLAKVETGGFAITAAGLAAVAAHDERNAT